MPSYSPWGKIQHQETLETGIHWVSTAGHGGYMVAKGFAERRFSTEARARGEGYPSLTGEYLCYEEDCKWAIVMWEMGDAFMDKHIRSFDGYGGKRVENIDQKRNYVKQTLSAWNPEYLISQGDTPSEPHYSQWLEMKREREMRANKDPDLIIAAWGYSQFTPEEKAIYPAGTIRVVTADETTHYITKEYATLTGIKLLSKCQELFQKVGE